MAGLRAATVLSLGHASLLANSAWIGMRVLCFLLAISAFWLAVVELILAALSHSPTDYFHWRPATLALSFAVVSTLIGTYYWRSAVANYLAAFAVYAIAVGSAGYSFGAPIGFSSGEPGYWWIFSDVRIAAALCLPGFLLLCYISVSGFAFGPQAIAPDRTALTGSRFGWLRDIGAAEIFAIILGLVVGSPGVLFVVVDKAQPLIKWIEVSPGFWSALIFYGLIVYIFAALFGIAVVLSRSLHRRIRRNAEQAIARDGRAPILLLRSFQDDKAAIRAKSLLARVQFRSVRLEEAVAGEVARLGPFVAIGTPGESLPQLGAYRLYLPDSDWQGQVIEWMREAAIIVVIAGTTNWVSWELRTIREAGLTRKVVVLFPPSDRDGLQLRWAKLLDCFGEHIVERPSDLENCLAAFVSSDGSLNMVVGRGRTQVDYELALLGALGRIGTNLEVCVDANERARLDGPLP